MELLPLLPPRPVFLGGAFNGAFLGLFFIMGPSVLGGGGFCCSCLLLLLPRCQWLLMPALGSEGVGRPSFSPDLMRLLAVILPIYYPGRRRLLLWSSFPHR